MAISTVTMYRCKENNKLYDSPEKAKAASRRHKAKAKREKERLEAEKKDMEEMHQRSNYVRLNATSSHHALELIAEKAKEYWDLDVKVERKGSVVLDVPREYKWPSYENKLYIDLTTVSISVSYEGKSNSHLERVKQKKGGMFPVDIKDLLFAPALGGFSGFRVGSGCYGCFSGNSPLARANFKADIKLIFDDFPLIVKRYAEWKDHRGKYREGLRKQGDIRSYSTELLCQDPQYIQLSEIEKYYEQCLDKVKRVKEDLHNYYTTSLSKLHSEYYPIHEIPPHLLNQFGR